uniref:Uncharacterized protein n=1 Tax=Ciona intestinalis TaxID=7719 RepID=F6QI30_CIOIN
MDQRLLTILLIGLVCFVKQGESHGYYYDQNSEKPMQKSAKDFWHHGNYYDNYYYDNDLENMMSNMPVEDHGYYY